MSQDDRRKVIGRKKSVKAPESSEELAGPLYSAPKKSTSQQPKRIVEPLEVLPTQPAFLCGLLVLATGIWAHFPTLVEMVEAWEKEPDYSHGYLVIPLCLFFLWLKRDVFPGVTSGDWLWGSLLLGSSIGIRLFSAAFHLVTFDGWSLLLWLAGCVALLFGRPVLAWSWTSIAYLFFMIPLPYRAEGLMSLPLQKIATKLSCFGLQLLGFPVVSEGTTLIVGENHLEVAEACSGLRLFVSILALSFAYLILTKTYWWEKVLILGSVVPVAIVSNVTRIIFTAFLYEYVSGEWAHSFSHDFAGWVMILFALALFWLVLQYFRLLLQPQEQMDMGEVLAASPHV